MHTNATQSPQNGKSNPEIKSIQLLKIQQLCNLTQLSRASVYRLAANGEFPKPITIGIRASAWKLTDIQAWLDNRESGVRSLA